jgi:hypothetical protein
MDRDCFGCYRIQLANFFRSNKIFSKGVKIVERKYEGNFLFAFNKLYL